MIGVQREEQQRTDCRSGLKETEAARCVSLDSSFFFLFAKTENQYAGTVWIQCLVW